MQVDVGPIVEAGTLEVLVVQGKTQLSDQVQPGSGGGTQTGDVAGVRGDFRFDQDDIERLNRHGVSFHASGDGPRTTGSVATESPLRYAR